MTAPARPVLAGRELEVLLLLSQGLNHNQIAARLKVEPITVRVYAKRMRDRFGAATNPQAVLLACQAGVLDGQRQSHGDHNGYEAHIRRGDRGRDICDPCREGEKAYRAGLRKARQVQEGLSVPVSATFSAPTGSGPSGLESASEAHSPASRPTNQTKAA